MLADMPTANRTKRILKVHCRKLECLRPAPAAWPNALGFIKANLDDTCKLLHVYHAGINDASIFQNVILTIFLCRCAQLRGDWSWYFRCRVDLCLAAGLTVCPYTFLRPYQFWHSSCARRGFVDGILFFARGWQRRHHREAIVWCYWALSSSTDAANNAIAASCSSPSGRAQGSVFSLCFFGCYQSHRLSI